MPLLLAWVAASYCFCENMFKLEPCCSTAPLSGPFPQLLSELRTLRPVLESFLHPTDGRIILQQNRGGEGNEGGKATRGGRQTGNRIDTGNRRLVQAADQGRAGGHRHQGAIHWLAVGQNLPLQRTSRPFVVLQITPAHIRTTGTNGRPVELR